MRMRGSKYNGGIYNMQFSFVEYAGDSLVTAFEKRISRILNGRRSKLSLRSSNLPFGFSFSLVRVLDQNGIPNDA